MDPFEVMGLPKRFDLDRAELERRYRELQRVFHPDRYAGKPAAERRMAMARAVEINDAYRILGDELLRAETLLGSPAKPIEASPELLMETMERREELSAVRRDREGLRRLIASARSRWNETIVQLSDFFRTGQGEQAERTLVALRYQRRFLEEAEAFAESVDEVTS